MILYIFTIHDKKAEAYLPPFYLPQSGMATRTFSDCVNDKSHSFSLHPQDYTLMSIGTFDDTTAIAITHPPESIGNGLEFIEKSDEENMPGWNEQLDQKRFENQKNNSEGKKL